MSNIPEITPERQALLLGLAQQAAAWWRDQVAGPGYLSKFRNGDTSQAGETAQLLASMAALQSPQPAAEAFDRFEQALTARVLAFLQRDPSPSRSYEGVARYLVLSVDYAPEGELRKAAEDARLTSGFPWKTTMWVNWDARPECCHVEVRAGYGAPTQRLPAPAPQAPATDY
ncbi:MAG: hypothetical protein ACRYF0_04215 [Janthinobacterium lividum]